MLSVVLVRRAALHALLLACSVACSVACSETKAPEPFLIEGLAACPDAGCSTHRAIGGISMGGGAAMRWALEYPELFDVAISLGSPYIDLEYFLISVSEVSNGGFCPRDQLLANLERIDLKDDPTTWCGPIHFAELALPNTACDGFSGDYNHHYRGPSAGSGGSFNREESLRIVQDLALAYGNPAFYNPEDPYLPPGVPLSHHVPIELDRGRDAERTMARDRICANPIVLERFYDSAYNPTGEHPVITFCDGNGPINGEYEPGVATFPMEVALAVDLNRNGRRDYGEPVIAQPFELWSDFGSDAIPSEMEPGFDPITNPDPNGDDYHWLDRPLGTERNFRPDVGEPQQDDGLDNVAGTGDFGEGNGAGDRNPNVDYWFERSPRKLLEEIDPKLLDRLHLWADAGIRDFLLSAQITNQFWGSLIARGEEGTLISDWSHLAELAHAGGEYDARIADLSEEKIGRHAYLRYGDPSVCPGVDAETGRGNHVGSTREALDRILTAFAFASARLPGGDFRALSGSLADQGAPTGSIGDFVMVRSFASAALERDVPYVVMLPPDYYRSAESRYPVVYFFHGQGQAVTDLAASALLLLGPQMTSNDSERMRAGRADWQKMIIVLADGQCRTEEGECHTGTFFIDHRGAGGESFAHGRAFLELMGEIDRTFRTKAPELLAK
jgi:hypothetical protein